MQRLFSMFPSGLPGFALLLLLRGSVALAVLLEGYAHRQERAYFVDAYRFGRRIVLPPK
jgi:hypothetical protein